MLDGEITFMINYYEKDMFLLLHHHMITSFIIHINLGNAIDNCSR